MSFGHGSSSSSTRLSPLARPFTVNCSAPKPKSSPPPHVFENPYDCVPPRPSLYSYFRSHSANSTPLIGSFPHLNPDVDSVQGHEYIGAQSISSCGTRLPSLNPNIDDFSYGQYSESVGNNVIGADPYYLQYPSAIHDTNSSVLKESGYVILNSGTAAPLEGSSQSDYVQNLTDFGCGAKWSGQWKDVDASSLWKEPKGKVVSPYRSSLELGAPITEGFIACEEAQGTWHGNFVESSARKVVIGSTGTSPERVDAKDSAISEVHASFPSSNVPGMSVLVPSTIQEKMCSHIPDPFFMKAWSPFNQNMVSYDRCFTPLDSCTTDPTIFYPSQSVPPASGSSSLLGKVVLKDMKFCHCPMDAFNNKGSVGQVSVKVKAPTDTMNADASKINNDKGKDDHISVESPPAKGRPFNQKSISDNSNDSSNKEFELKLTRPKASTHAPGSDVPADSLQSSFDALDQFISAVDSPCWKGTSSWHSPFTVVEAEAPSSVAKEPEGCNDLTQHSRILSVNADYVESVSFPESCGSFNNHPSVACSLSAEYKLDDADKKSGSNCLKPGSESGTHCSDGLLNIGNGYVFSKNPKSSSGLKTSDVMPLIHEEVSSAEKPMPQTRIKEPGTDFSAARDGSYLRSHKEHACNPSSEGCVPNEAAKIFKASDMPSQNSVARLDVSMLVKGIHNLSEFLISIHCSDANALKENDCEGICLAIDNLVGLVRQLPKSIPEFGSSYCIRKSTDPHKGTTAGMPVATEVESGDVPSLSTHQSTVCWEGMMHSYSCKSGKKVSKVGVFAKSGEMGFDEDMGMIQGEHHLQTLLYKNLWIEAEAALCSIKYELQLARMEIEMEKSKQHQTKGFYSASFAAGKSTDTADVKNLLS